MSADVSQTSHMRRALFGIETETAIAGREATGSQRRWSKSDVMEAASAFGRRLIATYGCTNAFLSNGARCYIDIGSHPEYATPECTSLRQLIAAMKAGERVMTRYVSEASADLRTRGSAGFQLIANNRDSEGTLWGCHENYIAPRESPENNYWARLPGEIVAFFTSRQIMAGAGTIVQRNGVGSWRISQRFDAFEESVGSATTRARAIFNTRDEPHADADEWRRMHVIVGDTSMSEWTTFLKVGSTQLVVDMIYDGVDFSAWKLSDAPAAMRVFSSDLTAAAEVGLMNGGTASAVDVQRAFLEAAEKHFIDHESSLSAQETAEVLGMWRHAVNVLATHSMDTIVEELGNKVDWVIKYKLIESYRRARDLPLGSTRVQQLDISYHGLDPDTGLYNLLVKRDTVERGAADAAGVTPKSPRIVRMVDEADVAALVNDPPPTSRAAMRGRLIKTALHFGLMPGGDWKSFTTSSGVQRPAPPAARVRMNDPFATSCAAADVAMAAMERLGRTPPPAPALG